MTEEQRRRREELRRRRRRDRHRRIWLELTFDVIPADVPAAVVGLWAAGGTSTAVACEILDVDPGGLHVIANRLGIQITRT